MTLLAKELKKVFFSAAWALAAAALLLMVLSQGVLVYDEGDKYTEPQPGQESYGMRITDDENSVMGGALSALFNEFKYNSYATYPVGFYRQVKLNAEEQRQVAEILSAFSGESVDRLLKTAEYFGMDGESEGVSYAYKPDGTVAAVKGSEENAADTILELSLLDGTSYDEFKDRMASVNKMLGGGSSYAPKSLARFGRIPMTYDEALAAYREDMAEGPAALYSRLYNDYAGLMYAILPVFAAVSLCLRDRRGALPELIYTRSISSLRLVAARYAAVVLSFILPALLLACISGLSVTALYQDSALDMLTPLKYTLGWSLPSVMISAAAGVFFTELTGTPIAVLIQGLWWFFDVNTGLQDAGNYPLFRLVPRHNSLGDARIFAERFTSLAMNRLFIAALSLALVFLTVWIYELIRRGKIHGLSFGKIFHRLKG